MKKYSVLICGLALAAMASTPMFADTFNFSFAGNSSVSGIPGTPFSGVGQFDAQATSTSGEFLITGVTGTTDGQVISGVLSPGSYGFNDNLLFFANGDSSASLDNAGVSYQLSNGVDVNLFLGVPSQYQQTLFGFANGLVVEAQTSPISITPAAVSTVPEPSSIALLGTGILGLAGMVRRRIAV
ncbi:MULTISPECIES: PEP-CTERM sorting domain-containing protein [Acidobacteriaceae]|uniref:PEP-CTERM sorting domain-containing protein n=1 Tax=Acidobacteriaceae TaxID=204434 RepID=UPI00131D2EF9|nr:MULTISPECIES: PEP-CTERM sorting domain-containing protein [Acidobacteriaceae]MDW5264266.1 PEP-CTERM sorting domain-containing protein [Edaphobacter sp.]